MYTMHPRANLQFYSKPHTQGACNFSCDLPPAHLGRVTGILFRATPVTRGCSGELRINLAAQFWTCQMESFHRVQWEPGEAELENISRRNKDHDETREAQGSESKIVLHFFFFFFFLHSVSKYKGQITHTYARTRGRAHTHTHTHTDTRTHACMHT